MVALQPVNDFDAGWVLVMGGSDGDQALASAELGIILPDSYGPDMWEPVAPMAQARQDFTAVSWGGSLAMPSAGTTAARRCPPRKSSAAGPANGRPDRRW